MTFGAPHLLWLLAALPLLIALFFSNERRARQNVGRLVAARLLPRLAASVSLPKRRLRFLLFLLGFALAIVALAQPRYGFDWQTAKRKGRDLIVAVDTSRSMLANDLAPNRLTRAKLAALDLISELQGDRVGLIAFAGSAFLQAPLTVDYSAVIESVNELDTEIIPQGGTNIAAMIRTAAEAFGKGESDSRALIIFTDGEELDADGIKAAEEVKDAIRIFTVGLGSAEGALIPLPASDGGTDFVKDAGGQIVKSRLDEERLRKIAEPTGGFYVHLQSGRPEMSKIVEDGLEKMTEKDIDAKTSRTPIERYQWPLAAAALLLASTLLVGERRRGPALRRQALSLLLLFLFTSHARAVNPGVEAFARQDYATATQKFSDQLELQPGSAALHFNLGSSAYKERKYDEALAAFSRALTSPEPELREKAEYNLGNTLFQRGAAKKERPEQIKEWKGALQHYEEALKIDPKDADTIYNRDLVTKLLEENEQEQKQEQQKNDQDQKKDDQKDKQDQKDQDQKQDEQQQKDQGQDQKKDQQDEQGQKDQKDQQGQQDQKDQQPQQGQEQKDPSGDPKDGEQKGDRKKDEAGDSEGDRKDQQPPPPEQDGRNGEQKQKEGEQSKAPEPEPMPEDEGKKKEGEIRSAQPQGTPEQDAAEQDAANAQAAAAGEMTEQQAKDLLESLKGEDTRVQLLDPRERSRNQRVLKNW